MHVTDPAPAPVARLHSLTGLRWWAAFGVFLHHMTNLAPLPIHAAFALGTYGVMFFFVLSGFVLTWSARDIPTSTFYWRRFARIYPAHLVALALAIPVFYSLTPAADAWWVKPFDLGVILLSVVLLQGWWREPAILFSGNPAAWTLTCEAFFYALHPWLSRVLRVVGSRGALIAALLLVIGAFLWRTIDVTAPGALPGAIPWPIARLSEFVLGMVLAHAIRRGWIPRLRIGPVLGASAAVIAIAGVALGTWWMGTVGDALLLYLNEWMLVVCAAVIVAAVSGDLAGRRSILRSRVLIALGEASYAFYLVHATIIYATLGVVGRQVGPGALAWYPVMLVVSLVVAVALHRGVERPAERWLRRWWDARSARPTAVPQ